MSGTGGGWSKGIGTDTVSYRNNGKGNELFSTIEGVDGSLIMCY